MSSRDLQQQLDQGAVLLFDLDEIGRSEGASGRVMLRFTGGDRVRYLNGQVSNDTRRLRPERGSEAMAACVMNAKGKMNAYCWIHATEDALVLDAEGGDEEFREALAMRLERYIIADDVEMTDVSEDWALLHLAAAEPGKLEEVMKEEALEWRKAARFFCAGVDVRVPAAEKARYVEKLSARTGVVTANAEEAEAFRVAQGVPRWGKELDENTLPAEAGLDSSAIDFHKGCYIGQEIISRIKSVGRVNRRLGRFVSNERLESGMILKNSTGQPAGTITSAVWKDGEGKALALGYLKRGNEETGFFAVRAGEDAREESIRVEFQPILPIS